MGSNLGYLLNNLLLYLYTIIVNLFKMQQDIKSNIHTTMTSKLRKSIMKTQIQMHAQKIWVELRINLKTGLTRQIWASKAQFFWRDDSYKSIYRKGLGVITLLKRLFLRHLWIGKKMASNFYTVAKMYFIVMWSWHLWKIQFVFY